MYLTCWWIFINLHLGCWLYTCRRLQRVILKYYMILNILFYTALIFLWLYVWWSSSKHFDWSACNHILPLFDVDNQFDICSLFIKVFESSLYVYHSDVHSPTKLDISPWIYVAFEDSYFKEEALKSGKNLCITKHKHTMSSPPLSISKRMGKRP